MLFHGNGNDRSRLIAVMSQCKFLLHWLLLYYCHMENLQSLNAEGHRRPACLSVSMSLLEILVRKVKERQADSSAGFG